MRFFYPNGLRYRSYNHSDIPVLRRKDIFLCSVRNGYILQDQCKVYRQLISGHGQDNFFQSDISYIPGISLNPVLCLHAKTLGFVHPITGEYLRFDSDLPDYFTHFLATLRRKNP